MEGQKILRVSVLAILAAVALACTDPAAGGADTPPAQPAGATPAAGDSGGATAAPDGPDDYGY